MNVNEKKLIAALLEMAAEQFSNHGCNDFYLAPLIPDVEDRRRLMKEYHDSNGDPECFDAGSEYKVVMDFALMGFLAKKVLADALYQ